MNWFRFYHDSLDNPKVQLLPANVFKTWINLLCLASKTNGQRGTLPSMDRVAFALRISQADAEAMTAALIDAGLIDRADDGLVMHDWGDFQYVSDNSTERVKRFRGRFSNGSVTPPERKKEQIQKEQNQEKNSPKRNSSLGAKEALAPARSLPLGARVRSPASAQPEETLEQRRAVAKRIMAEYNSAIGRHP